MLLDEFGMNTPLPKRDFVPPRKNYKLRYYDWESMAKKFLSTVLPTTMGGFA
jgi:hypothetical protein